MKASAGILPKAFIGLFIGLLAVMLYGYFKGYDLSIPWNVTTSAESEEVLVHRFQKGPFTFDFQGTAYELAENFSAGPIETNATTNAFFLGTIFFGICMILGVSTYLSRLWFIGIAGLFIFFIINLRLQDIGLFGFAVRSSLPFIIILVGYLVPSYLFHAFYSGTHFLIRFGTLIVVSVLIVVCSQTDPVILQNQLITGSYFGLVIVALVFLLIIAEENIFGILFLITQSKGGRNNHIHFSVFSLIYLAFLGAYYGKKSGLISLELTYFDPYILLAISSFVALWSLKFKQGIFENIISPEHLKLVFTGLGITTFGFLGLAFFQGNDAVYEGLHYFIIYCHLGFGVMFFFYLLLNFINPLSKGLQVFKVAYKEQNFPYVTAKLAGIAAVAGFFFLASKEPFLLFRAGHYNYLGIQAESTGEVPLAQEYFREGSIYGHDNHFSNYKIAYHQLQNQDIDEATYRFRRATLRYPSPQSFVNHSSTLAMQGESTPSLVSLKEGLRQFPSNNQLLNNLGLTYLDLGETKQALQYLNRSGSGDKWTNANEVNRWKVQPLDTSAAIKAYNEGNIAVKTNILHRQLKDGISLNVPFDSSFLYPSYPLHRVTYLINAAWFFQNEELGSHLERALSQGLMDESVFQNAKHAASLSNYLQGDVNQAVLSHDILRVESRDIFQAEYLHEAGLMALEQHALPNALNFFEQAIIEGSQKALISKTATLLEMGKLDEAIKWTESLAQKDSGYFRLMNDLQKIKTKGELPLDDQLTRAYYFYRDYSMAEMSALISQADSNYVKSLWKKVAAEHLLNESYEELQSYIDLFKSLIAPQNFSEARVLIKLANNEIPEQSNHPLAEAIKMETDSIRARVLEELSHQNALNVPLLIASVKELNQVDESAAYNALVEAYNLNRFSPKIIKSYVEQCLQMGLTDYATAPLDRLSELASEDDYYEFVAYVNEQLRKIEEESDW